MDLRVFENKILRRILEPKRDNNGGPYCKFSDVTHKVRTQIIRDMGIALEQWRVSIGCWIRGTKLIPSTNSKELSASPWFLLLVVAILLVIGGVEMNPGPDKVGQLRYKKTTGAANMAGELFEVKMATMLFLRALNSNYFPRIASNMAAAGSFDDVVFTVENQTTFLQLKHRENKNARIYMPHLLTLKGDFTLLKYCKSYLDMKQQWQQNEDLQCCGSFEDSLFIVFTNASLDSKVGGNVGSSRMLDLINTQGKLIQFTEQQHGHIYHMFDSLPTYKQLLSEAVNGEEVADTPALLEVVHTLSNNTAKCLPPKKDLVKLLADLKSLGDLSGYRDFLSQLWFFTEQAGESGLDNLIRTEINHLFGNDAYFDKIMLGVQKWWRKSNVYLTNQSNFFQDIIQEIATNITKNVSILKTRFTENECDIIRQNLTSGNRMLYVHTDSIILSSIKVLQSFQTNLLVDVSILQTRQNEVLAVWKLGMCHVLVVEGETTDANILQKLASTPDSKCVVVISGTEPKELYKQFKFVSITDTFCLSQLDSDSQREVLEQEVVFQGFPVKLNSMADKSFLQSEVTADVVVQLDHTLQIGNKLGDLDPCYIPRTFLRREYVSEQIFKEEHIILAVTEVSENRLTKLIQHVKEVHLGKICEHTFIEGEAEFTDLCRLHENIHWIQVCKEGLLWMKSKGSISPVIKNLEHKCVTYAGAEELMALPRQMILIVAEPGMGKTTELCNIAHKIKQKDPSTWVIRVDLNQLTNLLGQSHIDAVEFLKTVATLETVFQKRLFEHQLESNGNIVILLDGFDEISPRYSQNVFSLLETFSKTRINKIFVTSRPVILEQLQQKLSTLAFSFQAFTPEDQENFLTRYWNQLSSESEGSFKLSNFISLLLQLLRTSLNDKWKEFTGIPLQCKMLAEIFQDQVPHYCQTGEVRLPQTLDVLQLYDRFVDKKWEVYCMKMYLEMKNAILESLIDSKKIQFQQSLMNCAMFAILDENDIKCLRSSRKISKQNQIFIKGFTSGQDRIGIVIDIVNDKAVFVHRTFAEYFVAMWYSENFDFELNNVKNIYFNENFEIVQKFLDRILAREYELHTAVLNEDLSNVKYLMTTENIDVNEKDEGGRTALHLAIMNYYYSKNNVNDFIIDILLEYGADITCEVDVWNWSPLRLAEEIRAWSVVEKLLEKQTDNTDLIWIRASIEKLNPWEAMIQGFDEPENSDSKCGMSVQYYMNALLRNEMYTILSEGYLNLVKFVLSCGVNVAHYITVGDNNHKSSMLNIAVESRQLRLAEFLIQQGADVNLFYENDSPLTCAVYCHDAQMVELLINHGASVNARNKYGNSAILSAANMGNCKIMDLLLQKEIDTGDGLDSRIPLMMQAAESGHAQMVEFLINQGVSVNAKNHVGETALFLAAGKGKSEVVELLIKKGVDVHMCNDSKVTPLMDAVFYFHMQVAELLMNHGVSVNARDERGNTALSIAADCGDYKFVDLLLRNGALINTMGGEDRSKPLLMAARWGHIQAAELLINHGAPANVRSEHGETALFLTASKGNYAFVKLLLEKGADVHLSDDVLNRTPLMEAAEHGHLQIAELLTGHGASVNARDKYGKTALLLTVNKGKYEIVELLLRKGADVNLSDDVDNRTPLMEAAEHGHLQIAELLTGHGASVNARDKYGKTALLLTVNKGKYEIVELLLKKGADANISNDCNATPLMEAAEHGHVQIAELLIGRGASVNSRDKHGNTALSLIGSKGIEFSRQKWADINTSDGVPDVTAILQAINDHHVKVAELLINHGASLNAKDTKGDTALSKAAAMGKPDVVELLLQKGADVNVSNDCNTTPLMEAAVWGHVKVVELLIKHGASLCARDEYGDTALSKAAAMGKPDVVDLLLQKGADVEISDRYNRTPLMKGTEHGHIQVVELLIKHKASVNAKSNGGSNALSIAAGDGNYELVELLLQKGADVNISDGSPLIQAAYHGHVQIAEHLLNQGASVNTKSKGGRSALTFAVTEGKYKVVELLLKRGADVNISDEKLKRTPLMEAAERGYVQIAELLINHGAFVCTVDKYGDTAFSLAAHNENYNVLDLLLRRGSDVEGNSQMETAQCDDVQITELLLNHEACVNLRAEHSKTALTFAASNGKHEVVELLLQKGVDVNVKQGQYSGTPLMIVARSGHLQVVELLLSHGAFVNARDEQGETALSLAANMGRHETVKLLLQKGADVDVKEDQNSRTPLMCAAHSGHVEVVEILLHHGASVNETDKDGNTALSLAANMKIVELLIRHGAEGTSNLSHTIPIDDDFWCIIEDMI